MKYDYKIEKMPGYGYPAPYDKDEKHKRIWQVVFIERDDMGAPANDIHVRSNNLTYDEAMSTANELRQELRKAERENNK
ncbi:MAG TPA: hypothetical protein VF599_01705 [Pyrinomonadaceae bacterium]|jgi:hypothetical protein